MSDISDLSLDQQMLYRAAECARLSERWWLRPLRGFLHSRAQEYALWARRTRCLERALDEIVANAQEEAMAALANEKRKIDAVRMRVSAELDHIVATYSERRK